MPRRTQLVRSTLRRSDSGGSTPSSSDACCADWGLTVARYFFVDPVNGDDANIGYIDAAPGTVFAAGAGLAVAKQTFAGLRAVLPSAGSNRTAVVLFATGTYAEEFDWRGIGGYSRLVRRGSDFSNSATDKFVAGFVQAQVGPGAGGVWTVDAGPSATVIPVTSATLNVGNALTGYRVRFVTGALTGQCRVIHQNTASAITLGANTSGTASAGDTFVIERPGVAHVGLWDVDARTNQAFNLSVIRDYPLVGFNNMTNAARSHVLGCRGGVGVTYCGVEQSGVAAGTQTVGYGAPGGNISVAASYVDETGASITVGMGVRTADAGNYSGIAGLTADHWYDVSDVPAKTPTQFPAGELLLCSASGYFRSGVKVISAGGSSPLAPLTGAGAFSLSRRVIGPFAATTVRGVLIDGAVASPTVAGAGIVFSTNIEIRNTVIQNVGNVPAIIGYGINLGVKLVNVTSGAGNNDVGLDLTNCIDSVVIHGGGTTVAGAVGQIRPSGGQIITFGNIDVASLRDAAGNVLQGLAGYTSLPMLKFSGLHSGVSEVTRTSYLADPGTTLLQILTPAQEYPMPAKWVSGLRLIAVANSATSPVTVTVMRNGAPTGLAATIGVGSVGVVIASGGVPQLFADGDRLALRVQSTDNTGDTEILATVELR